MPKKSIRVGVYPGTFDPITKGHMDIIKRALKIVDKLIIGIADDIPKTPIFNLQDRTDMVNKDIKSEDLKGEIEVTAFKGLLVDFAKNNDASIIIRGLRAVSDYEYELQLASMNSKMSPEIETVFLPASDSKHYIASSLVKEVSRLKGDVSPFVSENVAEKLKKYYAA